MDAATIAIICIVIGLIFLIAEALSPGFFLLIPGAIFTVVGVIGYFVDDFFTSWILAATVVVTAILASVVTIKAYQMLAKPAPPETLVAESMVGKDGTVMVNVEPGNLRGKVRIGSDTWSAMSESPIAAGTEVTVYAAQGVHVKVRPKQ